MKEYDIENRSTRRLIEDLKNPLHPENRDRILDELEKRDIESDKRSSERHLTNLNLTKIAAIAGILSSIFAIIAVFKKN